MGAGKTTLAQQIAKQYNYTYYDTDTIIERGYNTTIANLINTKGEGYFREIEAKVLKEIPLHQNTIIATGGGLPCYHNNMEWMNKSGITIYLKHSIEELKKRVENDTKNRPLLKNKKNLSLLAHIEELMKQRLPYYEQAKFVILSNEISPQTVINTAKKHC